MKKTIAILAAALAVFVALAMVACSGGGSGSGSGSGGKQKTIAEDNSVMQMSFTMPEGTEQIDINIAYNALGTATEKDVYYTLPDDKEVAFAWMANQPITDLFDPETTDSIDLAGQTAYYMTVSGMYVACVQIGQDLYAITYDGFESQEDIDAVLAGITFTDATDTQLYDRDIAGIGYSVDPAWGIQSCNVTVSGDAQGALEYKTVQWYFGEGDSVDFRFIVRCYYNTTLDAVLGEDADTEEVEIGGYTYTAVTASDEEPYSYYIQQGDNVYLIRNNGRTSLIWTTRSDESRAAFRQFLGTVTFQ